MLTDNAEKQIKEAGNRVRDPAINAYVRRVVCTIAGSYCNDIRVYLIRVPDFNASMMPNGVMQVWTGLLLRAQNEAQLAYVICHEVGHFLRRHTLKRMIDYRAKTDALAFVQLAVGAAGAVSGVNYGYISDIAAFVTMASLAAYSRDHERESDNVGFRLMIESGYDAYQAAPIWTQLIEEIEATDEGMSRSVFFSTHPSTDERVATLEKLASESYAKGDSFEQRYLEAILPIRGALFRDELRTRRFDRLQVVLDYHFETGAKVGELHYIQGELHRLRGEDGDEALAIAAYRQALDADGAPPEADRDLGLMLMEKQQTGEALGHLKAYLAAAPEAEDQAMVQSYILQLE